VTTVGRADGAFVHAASVAGQLACDLSPHASIVRRCAIALDLWRRLV
jgi:hypothetical protein